MDYEHLYLYLDTRPLEELRECMRSVINLVRSKPESEGRSLQGFLQFTSEDDVIMNTAEALFQLKQFQLVQRKTHHSVGVNTEAGEQCSVSTNTDDVLRCSVATSMDIARIPTSRTIGTNTDVAKKRRLCTTATNTVPSGESVPNCDSIINLSSRPIRNDKSLVTTVGQKRARTQADSPKIVWTPKMVRLHPTCNITTHVLNFDSHRTLFRLYSSRQDNSLNRAVTKYGTSNWAAVVKHVANSGGGGGGGGRGEACVKVEVSKQQCATRWSYHHKPLKESMDAVQVSREWTKAETAKLRTLVRRHTLQPYLSPYYNTMTKQRTEWTAVACALARTPAECRQKAIQLKSATMVKGPYSAAEDALILRRVQDWGDQGKGLWTSLQNEMNRSVKSIMSRWVKNLRDS